MTIWMIFSARRPKTIPWIPAVPTGTRCLPAFRQLNQKASRKKEKIIDAFVSYEGSDDLLKLQQAIATALCRAFELGSKGRSPDSPHTGLDEN